jgi:Ring finger domain
MSEHSEGFDTNDHVNNVVIDVPSLPPRVEEDFTNNDSEPDLEEQRFSLPQEWSDPSVVVPIHPIIRSPVSSPTDFPPLRPINPDEIVDSLEDSDGEESTVTHSPEDGPGSPSRYHRRRSCAYWTTRILCFPIWLLITVTTVSTVFAFCIIPGVFIVALTITFYYCCSRDPIPLDVLLQALFLDEETENNPNNAPPRSKEEIRSLLLCRTCLEIQPRHTDGNPTSGMMEPPNHAAILAEAPLSIPTEHYTLTFSGPMASSVLPTDPWTATRNFYLHMHDDYDDPASSVGAVRTRSGDSQDDNVSAMIEMTSMVEEPLPTSQHDSFSVPDGESKIDDLATDPVAVIDHKANEEDDDDEEYGSGMGCDICLRRYACHDVVAWSRNTACCTHAYHVDCITDWLQKKPTCPNCRGPYIALGSSSNKRGARSSNTNVGGGTAAERNG